MDLEESFVDLKMGFNDLGINFIDLETDSVGLGMDFVDGKHLGYFLDWCFGQVGEQRWTICYLDGP